MLHRYLWNSKFLISRVRQQYTNALPELVMVSLELTGDGVACGFDGSEVGGRGGLVWIFSVDAGDRFGEVSPGGDLKEGARMNIQTPVAHFPSIIRIV